MASTKTDVIKLNNGSTTAAHLGKTQTEGLGDILDALITATLTQSALPLVKASTTDGIIPSATVATYGTAFTVKPATGYKALSPVQVTFLNANTATETATMRVLATYNDGGTANVTKTATADGTTTFAQADLLPLWADGKYIVSIALAVKSSIVSSTVTSTGTVTGKSEALSSTLTALN